MFSFIWLPMKHWDCLKLSSFQGLFFPRPPILSVTMGLPTFMVGGNCTVMSHGTWHTEDIKKKLLNQFYFI